MVSYPNDKKKGLIFMVNEIAKETKEPGLKNKKPRTSLKI